MHPPYTAARGLQEAALARITGPSGGVQQARVSLTDELMRGVAILPHGWGHSLPGAKLAAAAERPGANLNAVLDEWMRDPLSGNAVLSGVAVEVEAA